MKLSFYFICVFLLTSILLAEPIPKERLADPMKMAKALPAKWNNMHLLSEKDWGKKKIAQMEISYARADYTSSDYKSEGSIELIDTIFSPMHRHDYFYEIESTPPERLFQWKVRNVKGCIIQDNAEGETRACILMKDRYLLKISVSPQVNNATIKKFIDKLLLSKQFKPFR